MRAAAAAGAVPFNKTDCGCPLLGYRQVQHEGGCACGEHLKHLTTVVDRRSSLQRALAQQVAWHAVYTCGAVSVER